MFARTLAYFWCLITLYCLGLEWWCIVTYRTVYIYASSMLIDFVPNYSNLFLSYDLLCYLSVVSSFDFG